MFMLRGSLQIIILGIYIAIQTSMFATCFVLWWRYIVRTCVCSIKKKLCYYSCKSLVWIGTHELCVLKIVLSSKKIFISLLLLLLLIVSLSLKFTSYYEKKNINNVRTEALIYDSSCLIEVNYKDFNRTYVGHILYLLIIICLLVILDCVIIIIKFIDDEGMFWIQS